MKMTEDASGRKPGSIKKSGPGKTSRAALSAALRANLQRRKARERALKEQVESAPPARDQDAPEENHEATWTK